MANVLPAYKLGGSEAYWPAPGGFLRDGDVERSQGRWGRWEVAATSTFPSLSRVTIYHLAQPLAPTPAKPASTCPHSSTCHQTESRIPAATPKAAPPSAVGGLKAASSSLAGSALSLESPGERRQSQNSDLYPDCRWWILRQIPSWRPGTKHHCRRPSSSQTDVSCRLGRSQAHQSGQFRCP